LGKSSGGFICNNNYLCIRGGVNMYWKRRLKPKTGDISLKMVKIL